MSKAKSGVSGCSLSPSSTYEIGHLSPFTKMEEDSNLLKAPTATTSGTSSGASSSINTRATSSPLPADALDYFSETAARLGGNGGSTGVMIQSPDGRPAGIFFHPRTNSGSIGSRTPGPLSSSGSRRRDSDDKRFAAAVHAHRSGQPSLHRQNTNSSNTGSIHSSPSKLSPSGSKGAFVIKSTKGDENGSVSTDSALNRTGISGSVDSKTASYEGGDEKTPSTNQATSSSTGSHQLPSLTPNGNIFAPQVGLESILSGQRPPKATPLMPIDSSGTIAAYDQAIPVTGLKSESISTRNGDQPRINTQISSKEGGSGNVSPTDVTSPTFHHPAAQATSPTQQYGRPSFGNEAGLNARQTFTSALPMTVARPSAQPQSGLLIGAGFSQPRSRGNLGPRKSAASIEVLPPIKVLIVEDNPINVKILSTFLKQRKIKYGVARDGREAVTEWQTGGYHLILMDIQLPVMDGIEATKEIRRMEQMANIGPLPSATTTASPKLSGSIEDKPNENSIGPVSPSIMLQNSSRASVIIVALTASVLNSDRVAALAAGCNDFLNKPVNLNWLERKVIEWGSMQYLIGFRDLPESYYQKRNARANSNMNSSSRKHQILSPTGKESLRTEGLLDRGFGSGPNQIARELANRLYIGKKARPTATAGDGT